MKPKKGERFLHFFFDFCFSFTHNKQKTLLLFSSQSPNNNNNNKKGLDFFHSHEEARRAAAEEKIEMMMMRCVVYSCFYEISLSLLFLFARCFLDILCVSLQIFKNQTNHKFKLNLLFSFSLVNEQQWRTGDASPGGRFTTALSFLLPKE